MSFHKVTEFAKLCGVGRHYVYEYIKRGKVIKSGDFIDDTIYENRKFMEERKVKIPLETLPAPKIEAPPKKKHEAPNIQVTATKGKSNFSLSDLDQAKKEAEIQVLHARNEKLQIEIQKLRGQSIPTQLVKNVFAVFGKEIMNRYKDSATILLGEFLHKTKASAQVSAEMNGRLIDLINEAQSDAVEKSKIEIQNIISQTKVSRDEDEDE